MLRIFLVLALTLVFGGDAFAGPFGLFPLLRRPLFPLFKRPNPMCTTPWFDYEREEVSAAEQSWPTSEEESTSSLPLGTALGQVPGTGSKLPITPKLEAPNAPATDAEIQKQIAELQARLQPKVQPVPIALPLDESTQQRWSRISMLLEVLLWLGGGLGVTSLLGRFGQLVAPLVSGLLNRSLPPAPQQSPNQTANTSFPKVQ
jgi:hypothetical protein